MTSDDVVVRLDAKLAAVDRQRGRAIVTFLVRDDDQLQALEGAVGADCMLGVLMDHQAPLPPS